MNAHTPGPWHTNDHGLVTRNDGRNVVAFVRGSDGDEVVLANARLIAAAPDLLSALQMVLNEPSHATREQARAAIAKATGADK